MAFWGIEVKPGKPFIHRYDSEKGRLHLSQATLGTGSSTKKSIVQCKVGDKKPIYLCSLLPEKLETSALNHEFEEDDEVTFTVLGPYSVHLSGFFYGDYNDQDNEGDDYETDLYEEDVVVTTSEDEDASVEFDSEDEDDDFGLYHSSPVPNSGVKIEEIEDDDKPAKENGTVKHAKKKETKSTVSGASEDDNRQIVLSEAPAPVFQSEDEDGFPKSSLEKKSGTEVEEPKKETVTKKRQKENEKDNVSQGKGLKRKKDPMDQDDKPASGSIERDDSSVQINTVVPESESTQKDKKRKKKKRLAEKAESAQATEVPIPDGKEDSAVTEIGKDVKPSSEKNNEKKKKKKNKQKGIEVTSNAKDEKTSDKKTATDTEDEIESKKSLQVRSFPNGLMIEELSMGRPDGKRASPGKKVSVHYIGKLKNGKIFDSNIGKAPFKFRLGIGQVIKGWDVGVSGMRIGDKRRLTIPPAMGYGSSWSGPIPPNSWLVFDVELVNVN